MGIASFSGASSVIKPGVVTSSTRPSSPFVGQLIYETDTARLAAYNGSAWVSQNSLQFIAASGAQSAQASISFNNCFSATYMNYRIIMENVIQSVANNMQMRLRVGGVDTSGSSYRTTRIECNDSPSVSGVSVASTSYWTPSYVSASTDGTSLVMDIFRPFATSVTMATAQSSRTDSATSLNSTISSHYHTTSTSFDGFTIVPSSGTVTCTNIRVYGYSNS